jgi:hypothetical protein
MPDRNKYSSMLLLNFKYDFRFAESLINSLYHSIKISFDILLATPDGNPLKEVQKES